jgi:ATP-dependent Clp protease adaptor protein ClpS
MPAAPIHATIEAPEATTVTDSKLADMYEVILYNDDHNTMDTVLDALMAIFAHPIELAMRIMLEAHHRGKAIAEVEEKEQAKTHTRQLIDRGLTADARPL